MSLPLTLDSVNVENNESDVKSTVLNNKASQTR